MNFPQSSKSGYAGLISIVSLYIILIILILIFAGKILLQISTGESLSTLSFLPLALVLPLFLLITIGYNVIKLIQQKKRNKPGSNLKTKLLVFFTFITILSSVPQGILAVNFINSALKSWFSAGIENALRGGLGIAMEYNRSIMENISFFRDSLVYENIVTNTEISGDTLWENLKGASPFISSITLFDSDGRIILDKGEKTTSDSFSIQNIENRTVTRSKEGSRSIIRTRRDFVIDGRHISSVLAIVLPDNFDNSAKDITNALQLFNQSREFQTEFLLALILFYVYFSLPIILLSILISFLLSEELIQPVAHLEEAIKRVIRGDYSYRILTHSKNDLGDLTNSFNLMVSELDTARTKFVQNQKVTAWQEIAQRMAHEIKNPLTPIKLSAQRILRKYQTDPEALGTVLEPAVDAIINEVGNLTELLSQFRDFARMPLPEMEEIQLRDLVKDASVLYAESNPAVRLNMDNLEDVSLRGDYNQIKRVFSNLISNAFEAIDGEGEITLNSRIIKKGGIEYCRISVTDTGSGIDKDVYKQIFNPYFTTKERGTGLGLSIVERILSDHGGKIWYESETGVGTTFYIELLMGKFYE